MARQDLLNFINAVERSPLLRKELNTCKNEEGLIKLANKYGFKISLFDIENESKAIEIEQWFKESQIAPISKYKS